MIYLDNAATTRCRQEVIDVMNNYQTHDFFNASSVYAPAVSVRKDIDEARNSILDILCASDHKLVFVSSATEANNLIFSSINLRPGDKILISVGEHPSVFECAKSYAQKGVCVEYVNLLENGELDTCDLKRKMTKEVKLVSCMLVSNETGAISDIKKICEIVKSVNNKTLVACDGVQAFGKIDVCIDDLGVDFFVVSAHKIHGPKGVGALIYNKDIKIVPLMIGGGQENGLRSGTENVAGILGLKIASEIASENLKNNYVKVSAVKQNIIDELYNNNVDFMINGNGSPYILSLSFDGVRGEVLLHSLEADNIYISTGSACSSKHQDNRILEAMGRSKKEVMGSVRLSFNPYDEYDAKYIANKISTKVKMLKG